MDPLGSWFGRTDETGNRIGTSERVTDTTRAQGVHRIKHMDWFCLFVFSETVFIRRCLRAPSLAPHAWLSQSIRSLKTRGVLSPLLPAAGSLLCLSQFSFHLRWLQY